MSRSFRLALALRRASLSLPIVLASAAFAQPVFDTMVFDANQSGSSKAFADIDGDGKDDPIVASFSLVWYESGANFAKRTIRTTEVYEEFTTDMQAADVDGDG